MHQSDRIFFDQAKNDINVRSCLNLIHNHFMEILEKDKPMLSLYKILEKDKPMISLYKKVK